MEGSFDTIALAGSSAASFADIPNSMAQSGSDVMITIEVGYFMVLDTNLAQLGAADFLFV